MNQNLLDRSYAALLAGAKAASPSIDYDRNGYAPIWQENLVNGLPPRYRGESDQACSIMSLCGKGIVPRSVELCEASAAVNDVKRPSRFEQQRDCLFPFRSE